MQIEETLDEPAHAVLGIAEAAGTVLDDEFADLDSRGRRPAPG